MCMRRDFIRHLVAVNLVKIVWVPRSCSEMNLGGKFGILLLIESCCQQIISKEVMLGKLL